MSFKKGDLVEIIYGNYKGFVLEVLNFENKTIWLGNKDLGSLVGVQEEHIKLYEQHTPKVDVNIKALSPEYLISKWFDMCEDYNSTKRMSEELKMIINNVTECRVQELSEGE